ncbi:cell division protein SepF [Anthocerotibacter panamensis]|uniref:cell division protein SepF n=1 Tax=Anthocerotibacter panamensis TaxID=2857077 RepID=UPI001C40317E|nr:cell division protein SepF [Anthocerotibacter panamensis]
MASLWSRFKEFVGLGEDLIEEYEEADYSQLYQQQNPTNPAEPTREDRKTRAERLQQQNSTVPAAPTSTAESPRRRSGSNVIGLPNAASQAEVFVIEPKSFEDAPQLIQYLRERKSLVLNLTMIDAEQAQRTVDFVAGATYALDGHQERLGDGIFLFTPSSVLISSSSRVAKAVEESELGGFKFDTEWRSGT